MRIFHIATAADWAQARASGSYTTSTRGRTLAEEGFIHASRGDQWQAVRDRFYADVTEPLVLLVIDPERLSSPVVEEAVPGTTETYPHVYGAIDVDAVVQTIPLDQAPAAPRAAAASASPEPTTAAPGTPAPSFSRLFLQEMFRNVMVASIVLACVALATLLGLAVEDEWGPITGAVVGLVVGLVVVRLTFGRKEA